MCEAELNAPQQLLLLQAALAYAEQTCRGDLLNHVLEVQAMTCLGSIRSPAEVLAMARRDCSCRHECTLRGFDLVVEVIYHWVDAEEARREIGLEVRATVERAGPYPGVMVALLHRSLPPWSRANGKPWWSLTPCFSI